MNNVSRLIEVTEIQFELLQSWTVCCGAVERCQPLPLVPNATVTYFNSSARTLTLTCLPGFRFSNGLSSRQMTCRQDSSWHVPESCQRSQFSLLYVTRLLYYPRDAMLARVFATATCLSVCLSFWTSVCHTPVLCLAERKQDREMYTI